MRVRIADVFFRLQPDPDPKERCGAEAEEYLDNRIWQVKETDADAAEEDLILFRPAAQLPPVGGKLLWESDTCTIRQSGNTVIRVYHDGFIRQPYAVCFPGKGNETIVLCEKEWFLQNRNRNYLFNVCALEKRLLQKQRAVFHSCYVERKGKAVLFSGPSGIGKSTQGTLWKTYRGAAVVNGDRSVIGKRRETWYAYGFPFSGTSGICRNRSNPLVGIFFLKQANENKTRKLEPEQAALLLWEQFTVNQWDPECVEDALRMADWIAAEVPVFELSCTPDERAVICAERALGWQEESRWM